MTQTDTCHYQTLDVRVVCREFIPLPQESWLTFGLCGFNWLGVKCPGVDGYIPVPFSTLTTPIPQVSWCLSGPLFKKGKGTRGEKSVFDVIPGSHSVRRCDCSP